MHFLRRLSPWHSRDVETDAIMTAYRERREAMKPIEEACHRQIKADLDATQEITKELLAQRVERESQHPVHHGSHS